MIKVTTNTIFKALVFYNDNPLQSIHESSKIPESGNFQCAPVWLTDDRVRYTRLGGSSMSKQRSNHPAAPAKSLQSCLTLCDPIEGSPPGSPIPGILQATTLEWVAISFSNAWKWKVKVKSLSHVRLFATPWTAAYQAPPSTGFSRQEDWSGVPSPSLQIILILVNKFLSSLSGLYSIILRKSDFPPST